MFSSCTLLLIDDDASIGIRGLHEMFQIFGIENIQVAAAWGYSCDYSVQFYLSTWGEHQHMGLQRAICFEIQNGNMKLFSPTLSLECGVQLSPQDCQYLLGPSLSFCLVFPHCWPSNIECKYGGIPFFMWYNSITCSLRDGPYISWQRLELTILIPDTNPLLYYT